MTSSAPGPAGPPTTARSKGLALTAMLFAVAMTFIDQTIVAIASPNIAQELDLSRSGVQWVINAYILALAAGFALGGRLADVLGSRRVVLVGIVGFAGASALCGFTPKGSYAEAWIIVFRAIQGLSAALMIPAALAVVVSSFPLRERGRALAIFFGVSGGLTAIGPIAGGYLTQWTWRAIFWINIPVAVLAVVLTLMAGIHSAPRRDRIDWRGAALVAAGMALSVYGFEQASSWGWGDGRTWACIIGGLVVLVVFVLVELRTPVPLIKIRIFTDRAFAVDNAVLFFSMVAFVPVFFFASVYSQVSLGYDANSAGLYLLLFFGGFAPAAQVGGRILDDRGAKPAIVAGSALGAVGFAPVGLEVDGPEPRLAVVGDSHRRRRHRPAARSGQHGRHQPGDQCLLRRGHRHHPDGPQLRLRAGPGGPGHRPRQRLHQSTDDLLRGLRIAARPGGGTGRDGGGQRRRRRCELGGPRRRSGRGRRSRSARRWRTISRWRPRRC